MKDLNNRIILRATESLDKISKELEVIRGKDLTKAKINKIKKLVDKIEETSDIVNYWLLKSNERLK